MKRMKHISYWLCLLLIVVGDPRCYAIVGGHVVQHGENPSESVVNVLNFGPPGRGLDHCSGTLIANDLVLTAAHCVTDIDDETKSSDESKLFIYFGNGDANNAELSMVRKVTAPAQILDNHTMKSFVRRDLALLKFEGLLPKGFGPAKVLLDGSKLVKGLAIEIAGYGDTNLVEEKNLFILKSYETKIHEVKNQLTGGMILFDTDGGGESGGDSGGPAYIKIDGVPVVFGIASGYISVDKTLYALYESIVEHSDWLIETARKMGSEISAL